jgi:tetratricopeptide (TPR) repeat protein
MCRSAADLRRRFGGLLALALLLASPAWAQRPEAAPEHQFQLNPSTRILLSRLQGQWLEWLAAVGREEEERSSEAIERLLAYAAQLEMQRLPELSVAASVMAVQEIRDGHAERASWALATAERLDPGRPETSFAAFTVDRVAGRRFLAALHLAQGWERTMRRPQTREVVLRSAVLWASVALVLAALLFVAIEIVLRGGRVYRDAANWLGRRLPSPWPGIGAALFLLWPLLIGDGWLWLALFGSLLIWLYASWTERVVLALAWVGLIAAPPLLAEQHRRIQLAAQPQVHAIESAARGRLEGGLLNDVATLRDRLPESTAVLHAVADLHRRFGQCDLAERYYARVLERDVEDPAALADLGVCAFDLGRFEGAIDLFHRAAEAGPPRAAVHFNLSQAMAELYRFTEAEVELRRARSIDAQRVNQWIRGRDPRAVVAVDGGLARSGEIRQELLEQWGGELSFADWLGDLRHTSAAPTALVCLLLAFGFRSLVRVRGPASDPESGRWFRGSTDLWRATLLPGVPEGEEAAWAEAFLMLLVFSALLLLLRIGALGLPIPWGYSQAPHLGAWLAWAGLVTLFIARWREQNGGYLW